MMKSLTDCYVIPNGVKIPCIGFGTWQAPDDEVGIASVMEAINAGYRHIDAAANYGNEKSVGKAIKQSGADRKDLFITSKLKNADHSYEKALAAFEQTAADLGTDYLDLYLIHWPNSIHFRDHWQEANAQTWRAFEKLYRDGRVRAIGVSNFRPHHFDALYETAEIAPMVSQMRLCPGDLQKESREYSLDKGMLIEAYSPLGNGKIFSAPEMKEFAEKYNKSVAQVCIRWSLQMGFLPLPKSITPERIRENAQVFDFELSSDDVARIAGFDGISGEAFNPDTITF